MPLKIEKGIPLPPRRSGLGGGYKYPWLLLRRGDSFFVEGTSIDTMRAGATGAGKRHGRKFVARAVEGGVRVWRVK